MEADPLNYKISNESPVGEALIGSKIDDEVQAETPNGVVKLKVLDIHR